MIKKFFIGAVMLTSLLGVTFIISESYTRPSSYAECVRNCQRSYAGNPSAINACISRCR
jgi:hypothetical protein